MSPVPSPPDVLVLLALRLTSLVEVDEIERRTGVEPVVSTTLLEVAEEAGWVRYREGRLHGWALTPAGRREGERLLAAELDEAGLRNAVHDAYERFGVLNGGLLQLCTEWQLREVGGERIVNDHSDADYDAACIERLQELHAKAEPVIADLASMFERLGPYPGRFDAALARVRQGEVDWFTAPAVDSYHTVWFELHEHLLATLGIERATERAEGR
jgi:hypothetical protein